jgi:hypothetical protein
MIDDDLRKRVQTLDHLSPDDWRQILGTLTDKANEQRAMHPSLLSALNIRITYDLVNALHRMDRTSAALATKLLVLTWLLVVFTAALLLEPAVHFIHWLMSTLPQ